MLGRIRADGAVYKAIDFTGSYVEKLNVAGRMTICNMTVEMGAKTAYMQPNSDVLNYVNKRAVRPYEVQFTDPDFQYAESYTFDVSKIEPNLACPSSVENVHPLSEVISSNRVLLNQGYIGSCTGGRVEDIAVAASIARVFFRNAINLGLVPIICKGIHTKTTDGQTLTIDLKGGQITIAETGETFSCEPLSNQALTILKAGGIKPLMRARFSKTR